MIPIAPHRPFLTSGTFKNTYLGERLVHDLFLHSGLPCLLEWTR